MRTDPEDTTDDDETTNKPKSELAQELERLKSSVDKLTQERERLPQPLFWSLFNSQIKEYKERKESMRRVDELLSKLD